MSGATRKWRLTVQTPSGVGRVFRGEIHGRNITVRSVVQAVSWTLGEDLEDVDRIVLVVHPRGSGDE